MQTVVRCENIFKSNDKQIRKEVFTEKWVKFVNQSIKNDKVILSK